MRVVPTEKLHEQYCPLRNVRIAALLVACLCWVTFVAWKPLHNDLERRTVIDAVFFLVGAAICARALTIFTCVRERLILGIVVVSLAASAFGGFFPATMEPYAHLLRAAKLTLWVVCLLVSLSMLVESIRSSRNEPTDEKGVAAGGGKL